MGLLQRSYRLDQATGVNVHVTADGYEVAICEICLKGQQLTFVKKITGLTNLAELKRHVSERSPVALNITGKGILIKTSAQDQKEQSMLANKDDLYIQSFLSGESLFTSIARKRDIEELLAKLQDLKINVLQVSFGPFSVANILPQLNFYGDTIAFNGHVITIDDEKDWTNYQYDHQRSEPFEIKADNEVLASELILPYAAAFQLLLAHTLEVVSVNIPVITARYESDNFRRKFRVQGLALLATVLLLLIINLLLLFHYNEENEHLTQRIGSFMVTRSDVNELNSKIDSSRSLLKQLGWDGKRVKALYIDSIARCVPKELTLTEVSIQPPSARGSGGEAPDFLPNTMRLAAFSKSAQPINEWVERLKLQHWVKSVRINEYKFDGEDGVGKVTIMVNY